MKKLMILVLLLATMLVAVAPAATAQFSPQLKTEEVQNIRQGDVENGDIGQDAGVAGESEEPSSNGTSSEPTEAAYATCDDFISLASYPSQYQAQQYFDFTATPQEQAILDTDGDGFACDGWSTGADTLGVQGGEDGYWASDGYYYYW